MFWRPDEESMLVVVAEVVVVVVVVVIVIVIVQAKHSHVVVQKALLNYKHNEPRNADLNTHRRILNCLPFI